MKKIIIKFNKTADPNGLHSETIWVADEVADAINSGDYKPKYDEFGKVIAVYNAYIDPKADSLVTKAAAALFELAMNLGYEEEEDLSDFEKEIMQLSNKLYDLLQVHKDYWQPNPDDNPELFFEDGDLNPTFKDVIDGEVSTPLNSPISKREINDMMFKAIETFKREYKIPKKEIAALLNISESSFSLMQKGERPVNFDFIDLSKVLTAKGYKVNMNVQEKIITITK